MPKAVPDGYHWVTPYLTFKNAAKAVQFYEKAFDAKELYRLPMPDGRLGHAELQIGNSRIMLADESPAAGNKSPSSISGTPVGLCLYTDNVDAVAQRFVNSGGKVTREIPNQFYGDRSGQFQDPEGYTWTLAQHIEVSPDEMKRRMEKR